MITLTSDVNSTLENNVTLISTDWQVSKQINFSTILIESLTDSVNKVSINFNIDVDSNIKYYARVRFLLSTGYTKWANIDVFTPVSDGEVVYNDIPVNVPGPILSTDSDSEAHIITGFTITAAGFNTGNKTTLISTDWFIEDLNGVVVWSSLDNFKSKDSILVDDVILKPNRVYRIRAIFNTSSNDSSQVGTMTICTGSNKDISLLTLFNSVNSKVDNDIEINHIPGAGSFAWFILDIDNKLNEVWSGTSTGTAKFKVTVPSNTLLENKKYLLKIKASNDDKYFTKMFSTF